MTTTVATDSGAWDAEDEPLTEQEMEFLSEEGEDDLPVYAPRVYAPAPMMPPAAYPPPPQLAQPGVPPSVASFAAARAVCAATKEQAQAAIRDAVQAGLVSVAQWVLETYQSQLAQCRESPAPAPPGMVRLPSGVRPLMPGRPQTPSPAAPVAAGPAITVGTGAGATRPASAAPAASQTPTPPKERPTTTSQPAARPAIIYTPRILRR